MKQKEIDERLKEAEEFLDGTGFTITGHSWNFTRQRLDIVVSPLPDGEEG